MSVTNWARQMMAKNTTFPPPASVLRAEIVLVSLLIAVLGSTPAHAQSGNSSCGSLSQGTSGYGPFDYRTDKPKLGVVEQYHFTPAVEALIRGSTNTLPGADLDYTLRAFPNHHKALLAVVRYGEKLKSPQPSGTHYSVECYFDRALRFRPDDMVVRMIYATFLAKNARLPEAFQQLGQAAGSAADNAFTHYNIGLIYFDLKEYDKALVQAHKAIALGFPRTDLRNQLQSVGKWSEPAELPATPSPDNSPAEQTK
jgi:hypothetical protein